ncbi:MAG: tRNA (adenosine(37)-N6)-dimethylallyltransferase MiaA, partial [Clostridia bacterium]|nr:tRNA (adenosine(37)-N6)-dimethylallyltransferase MiaA [Clostridia bacterium]
PNSKYNTEIIVLNADRQILYERIAKRVDIMLRNGLIEEVDNLVKCGIPWEAQSMQAIGYKEFKLYYDGAATIEEVRSSIITNTKRYAKRQLTWFRRYDFAKWFDIASEYDKAMVYAEKYIKNRRIL